MTEPQVSYVPRPNVTPEPEAFRNARAEAWRWAFACLAENRREDKQAAGRLLSSNGPDMREESGSDSHAARKYTG